MSSVMSAGPTAARDLQRDLFQRYGTTMNGLMAEHGLNPHDFLAYVHDIDYSPIDPDPRLDALLADLSGRKMIYTNGSVAHARNACDRLGVSHHFEVYFDIAAADFRPKPDRRHFATFSPPKPSTRHARCLSRTWRSTWNRPPRSA